MKMFLIVYSNAADTYVIAALKKAGIAQYTKMEEVHGEGIETEPKLGTHTWPGENNALFVAVPNEKVFLLTDILKQLKNEHPRAGVRGFILPMEECV
ncbi:MAG: PG0541 family transporter-associated protein [Syntrophaceae bacterium]